MLSNTKYCVDIRRIGFVYEIVDVRPDMPGLPVGRTFRSWEALYAAIVDEFEQQKIGPPGPSVTVSVPHEDDVRDETYRELLQAAGLRLVPEPDLKEHLQKRQEVWRGTFSTFQDNAE